VRYWLRLGSLVRCRRRERVQFQRQRRSSQRCNKRGRWRLLADQNNRASWSPLHLICVQGGITHGKVALLKALLQINNDDRHHLNFTTTTITAAVSRKQYETLTLLDQQKRNILHHRCTGLYSTRTCIKETCR